MIIKKIKLRNIRSYENLELEFPKGSILLSGDIGSGKTSILLGLQFALFGLQPGQKGNAILRQGKDEAYVSLETEIDGNSLILERTIKRSKNGSISQDTNIITYNGNTEELSTSEMKNRVISILNYPGEFAKKSNLLYKFTVYTPQESMKEIIQERPEIRLDTLRHIFGIDRYKRIQENAEILLQKIKENIKMKEVEIREINILKERFLREGEEKIFLSKDITNLNVEFKIIQKEKEESEERISSIQKTIEEKQKLDSELTKEQITLNAKQDLKLRSEREILLMQKQISEKLDFSPEKLREIVLHLERHKKILDELNHRYIQLNSEISVINSKKDSAFQLREKVAALDSCPTCQQSVGNEHKDKISKRTQYEIEDLNRELNDKVLDKQKVTREIENEKKSHSKL